MDRHQIESLSKRWAIIWAMLFLMEVLGDLGRGLAVGTTEEVEEKLRKYMHMNCLETFVKGNKG